MSETDDKLEATRKMMAELLDAMSEVHQAESSVNYSIREKNRELNSLNSKRLEIGNKAAILRSELADVKRTIEQLDRESAQDKKNAAVAAEFARQSALFDEALLKYEWGNKAKHHQIDGAKKLAIAKKAILGDKRGLGKTLTSIAWADLSGSRKILAVVPNDVRGNFEREIRYWAPHRSAVDIGNMSKIQRNGLLEVFKSVPDLFVLVNYEAWVKDKSLLQRLIDCHFDTVIADEAHMMKEMSTSAFRGVQRICHAENECPICGSENFQGDFWSAEQRAYTKRCFDCQAVQEKDGEFCSVKNILPMTGTPILNKPQDIFPLLNLIAPHVFYDKKMFLNSYCRQGYDNKWIFMEGGEERLATKLSGIYVARDRYQAGVEIPKQEIQIHELEMDREKYPKQWEAYQILSEKSALVLDDMFSDVENKAISPVLYMIALITRQRQMAVWPAGIEFRDPKTKDLLFKCDVTESVKLDYAEELALQLINDENEREIGRAHV